MELAIQVQVVELPEGVYLATSEELPGLVAQGRTVAEALDIAGDVARKLIEARRERGGVPDLPTAGAGRGALAAAKTRTVSHISPQRFADSIEASRWRNMVTVPVFASRRLESASASVARA